MTGKLCCRNERAEEQSLFRRCPSLLSLTLMSVLLLPLSLQAADIRRSGEDTFIIQQQRQEALEQQLTPSAPDVRLSAPGSFAHKINFPVETPCFQIKQTELKGADALPHWLPLQKIANGAVGHCLGAKGINLLMSTLQNRLVDHGYVTTRVLAPSQDLKSGILRLVIIPGVVRHVRLTPDSDDYIQLYSSFPAHEGSLLDLRDIEQGLENMQRLPGVQADMEIVPGEQPGESDILITRKQDKYWRLGFSLDDSGTRSTGRYLGGITFSLDNPFSLSDLLYVSATHNFPHYGGKGSKNYTAHYSVPFGYWQFSVTASDYDYHQTVAGAVEDYQYSGESQNLGMQLSRVLHRNGTQKTVLTYDVQARRSRNYINDTEIQVQRRQTAAWRLGLQHRHYISQAILDAGVSWQRGTRWFGAQPAPEEIFGEATALSKILQMNASFKGSEKGNGTTHTETTVDAGKQLTIISGRDTTLTGAQAGGETVKVDAGRHLTLTSEQDSDRYDSKQQNASAGGSFTFGSMSGSASVSLSRDKMHSNYDSVQEQTGIFAGRGGFDVTTGQHTQLNGAVIASTATADKNRLDTGTLGFSDIENRADFKTEHQSAGLSTGGSVAGNFLGNMANNLLVGANHEGHADSTTQSAVSAGNITIRDTQSQKQDVADLNRDAAHANQTLSPIFDREKEQQRLQQAQLIGEIGNQVADIARTEGQIAGEKAKRDPAALNQARAELEAAGKPFTEQDVAQRAYNNGMAASGFGTGGKYQQAIQAATAAVQGLAGGNLSAALAGGAAPYIAEIIKQTTPDGAGRVAAHAVVNAALAVAQGNNALAGAAGAATGEVVGMIATQMYGKPVSELSETEKQTVSTLATVAAGLAGGLVGDSGASAVAGVQSGKTTVENNALSKDKIFDINPMLKIGVEDVDGELLKGGGGIANGRPSHRQSEKDVGKDLGAGWREQVSYKDGKEVPYGTKGSTRPDWCNGNTCGIEVKNYNIATNINGLINNVSKQAIHRAENLPAGMQQRIIIDVRGQIVTPNQERTIIKGIVERSNGVIAPTSIRFKR